MVRDVSFSVMSASLLHLHATRSKRIGTLTSGLMSLVGDKLFDELNARYFIQEYLRIMYPEKCDDSDSPSDRPQNEF